jgi:hypothetical protein
VELRRLSKNRRILDEIKGQIDSLSKAFPNDLLLELLSDGGFLIFLDGFDEIPLSDREIVTSDIQDFISKSNKNKFVLTSRPESALKGFGDFQEFRIEPIKKDEAFELLRRYDKQGQVSSLLIKKLKEPSLSNIGEFLTNPLLVSLLFTAFQHRQTIPFKKHIFYRQVYDANFETHDLTKGDSFTHPKHCDLGIDDFHRVLRHIGFSCLKEDQRIEFHKDQLLLLVSKARAFCVDLDFRDSDFLNDIVSTVPLFSQDGNYFRWAHKSLQEYFAAQFIYLDTRNQKSDILIQMYKHPNIEKYLNVLDLYYDIDAKSFRSTVLYKLLEDFELHTKTCFKYFNTSIPKEDIDIRKALYFLNEPFVFLMPDKKSDVDDARFNEMLRGLSKKRFSGALDPINSDGMLYCLNVFDSRDVLIGLLSKKLPAVFRQWNRKLGSVKTNIVHTISNFYQPYFLSDAVECQFNSVANFSDVNNLIINCKISPHYIHIGYALDLLEDLRRQIEAEKSESFLL